MEGPVDESAGRAGDVLAFLAQSDNRVAVLSALTAGGRRDRYELEESLDATRRTLLRTINALSERGYVDETADGIGLTALGEHVISHYEDCVAGVALEPTVEEFLSSVPADTLGVDVERLRDGEVTAASPGSQYAALDRALDLRGEATRIRELAPAVEQRSVRQLAERVDRGEDIDVEIILTEETHRTAAELDQYSDAHETVLAADAVDIAIHPGPFDLALAILDETVLLIVGGREGESSAILETDDPAVRDWAETVIDQHRDASRTLEPEGSDQG